MEDLKKVWVQAGKSMVIAMSDLGASLIKTARIGVDAALEWAHKDNPHVQTTGHEVPDQKPIDESPEQTTEE